MKRRTATVVYSGIMLFNILGLFTGCNKIQLGEPFECRVGINYLLTPTLSFSVDSINDYRCPEDVVCIWAGDVNLHARIRSGFNETDTLIKLSESPYAIGDYNWNILEVKPLPRTTRKTEQSDYRIKVLIQENP